MMLGLAERACPLFNFAATETEPTIALVSSNSIEEIATKRGHRIPMLRTQLASMFAKTAADNQRDLVRLVGAIPQIKG